MLLQEIFDQLTHGELVQVHLGGSEEGAINPKNYIQVISHVNLGLTALHKRFLIRQQDFLLALEPEVTQYTLPVTDLLKVERVYTDAGYELDLNDLGNVMSLIMMSSRKIQVPEPIVNKVIGLPEELKTNNLRVVYRANHFKINEDTDLDFPEDLEVELPDVFLEPLLYFIASRVHNPMGMTNEFHAGNSYYAKYEAACQHIEQHNLSLGMASQHSRFSQNGWV